MSDEHGTANTTSCPDDVLRLIAWYPEGNLSAADRGKVEAHAAECRECRAEIAMIEGDDFEVPSDVDLESLPEAEGVYAAVLARIEDEALAGHADDPRVERLHTPRRRPSQWAAALAAGLAAVAVGVGLGVNFERGMSTQTAEAPGYSVAAGAPAVAEAQGPALDVIFRSDATADQITNALRALSAKVISGPTRMGVFRLVLRPDGDPAAAVEVLRAGGSGVATFAELVRTK